MAEHNCICLLCGHSFATEEEPDRCPECLRASGLHTGEGVVAGAKTSEGMRRKTFYPLMALVVALVVVGGLVAYFVLVADDHGPRERALVDAELTAVSLEAAPDPVASGAKLSALAQSHDLPSPASPVAERVVALSDFFATPSVNRALVLRGDEDPIVRAPLTAEDLAGLLVGGERLPPLLSLEGASLVAALADYLGLEAELQEDQSAPNSATSLARKRFMAHVAGAPGSPPVLFDHFGRTLDQDPGAPVDRDARRAYFQGLVTLAQAESEDYRAANEALSRSLALLPDCPSLLFLKGQLAVLRGMVQFGIEDMERAVARREDALGRYNLGVAYLQAQRFFKAHQALRRAVELDRQFVGGWLALANLHLARLPLSPAEEREGLIRSAEEAVDQARLIDPSAEGIAPVGAQVMLAQGDERGAFALLDDAIQANPERPAPYVLLGTMLANQQKWSEMLAYVRMGYAANPANSQLRHLLVTGYLAENRPDAARRVLSEALAANPSLPDIRVELASLLLEAGDTGGAERLLAEELDARPDSTMAALLLAQLDLEAGQPRESAERLDAVLERQPANFEALVLRYIVALELAREGEAAEILRRISTAQPHGRSYLAQMLLEQGMFERGVQVLRDVLRDRPDSVGDTTMLVAALTMADREEEAELAREQLLALAGDQREMIAQQLDAVQAEARQVRAAHQQGVHHHHAQGHHGHEDDEGAPSLPELDDLSPPPIPDLRFPRAPGEGPPDSPRLLDPPEMR